MKEQKHYLTKEGADKLKKEYEDLKKEKKEKLKNDTPEAFHSEDVNPEYITFQQSIANLEDRIARIERVLRSAKIAEKPPEDCDEVCVGSHVVVEEKGKKKKFHIVSTMEADPALFKISADSPVGKALLGKKKGEEVKITSPLNKNYKIKDIKHFS